MDSDKWGFKLAVAAQPSVGISFIRKASTNYYAYCFHSGPSETVEEALLPNRTEPEPQMVKARRHPNKMPASTTTVTS